MRQGISAFRLLPVGYGEPEVNRGMSATQAEKDDAYRAVGRWFVQFSRMLFHMRLCMEGCLGRPDDPMLAKLALGEMTADPLANAFFGMCFHAGELDDQEEKVAVRLRKEVRDEITRRNDFAHGDWWLALARRRTEPEAIPCCGGPSLLVSRNPG